MISEQQYNYLQDKIGKFQFMVSGMMSGWSPDMVKKYKKDYTLLMMVNYWNFFGNITRITTKKTVLFNMLLFHAL